MSSQNTLTKINLYDKLNAWFVSLITPEIPWLKQLRKENNYDPQVPTFDQPHEMPLEYVNIEGVKIRIAKSILGTTNPTIILLSTFPHSILSYSPIWEILKSDFNIYAYDMPGFGRSETSVEFMSFDFQGDFLHSFLQHFNVKNPHIVAPDVAMPTAISYVSSHKNDVQSLMIGDGPAILPGSNSSIIKKMTQSAFWRNMFVIAWSWALIESGNNLCNIKYVPNKYEISDFKESYKWKVRNTMKWFQKYEKDLPAINTMLSEITIPTKVFWWKYDAIIFSDDANTIHKKIPNSELEIFENSGHFVYQDQYENFAQMVYTFVNKNS